MISNTKRSLVLGLLVGLIAPGIRCQEPTPEVAPVDPASKAPITCLGRITDCATCPADALCTDITVGRIPGNSGNDWINDACACICPDGPQACVPIDSAAAEAALATARETARSAVTDAYEASRSAFAAAMNATVPDGMEVGSDAWFQWRVDVYMDAWDAHKNATHEAMLESQGDVMNAWEALMEMFGHGGDNAPVPEMAAPVPEMAAPVPEMAAPVPEPAAPAPGVN